MYVIYCNQKIPYKSIYYKNIKNGFKGKEQIEMNVTVHTMARGEWS
jgi:hypothetical protein